ncbi:MAG TPA: hypothetical protein VMT44_01630 [Methanoregula sp.]|nr:hypothetical protein [Methanoregula sp.]
MAGSQSAKYGAWASGTSFGKLDLVMVGVVFLQSLLISWFLFLLLQAAEVTTFFRFIEGLAILFAVLVPVFIILEGFRDTSITTGFFAPFVLYAFMFPFFNSLVSHLNEFLNPSVIIPALVGGLGFGLIGLGAYNLEREPSRTFALVTVGITVLFLSSPAVLAGFLYVFTGNLPSLPMLFG